MKQTRLFFQTHPVLQNCSSKNLFCLSKCKLYVYLNMFRSGKPVKKISKNIYIFIFNFL